MRSRRMPFGKFKGWALHDLPDDYLQWLQEIDLREPLRSAVLDEALNRDPCAGPTPTMTGCPDPEAARELIGAGLRSLARTRHPDAGGSHEEMIRVTAVADWLRARVDASAQGLA